MVCSGTQPRSEITAVRRPGRRGLSAKSPCVNLTPISQRPPEERDLNRGTLLPVKTGGAVLCYLVRRRDAGASRGDRRYGVSIPQVDGLFLPWCAIWR